MWTGNKVCVVLQRLGCSCHRLPQCPCPWRSRDDTVLGGSAETGWSQQSTATEAKVSWTAPLVRQHRKLFCWETLHFIQRKAYFFPPSKKPRIMKSQFSIQKMLMENLCPAMNTDWRYLDFRGKEGQVIFTVWKMKLTEFIFLCEAMIDFSFCASFIRR